MATRDDVRRRERLANNPGVHPDFRWWIAHVNRYLKRGPTLGLPTTTTTTSSSTTSTTTAP